MPNPTNPLPDPINPRALVRSRAESGTLELRPAELTKAGAFSVNNGVLTVKNEQLADLIHSKLADATKLLPGGVAASDVDVGVTVKVKS